MSFHIEIVAFKDNLLSRLAEDLLARTGAADPGHLSGCLVILPSARACRALGHILLEKSGRETLLLPVAVTPKQLLEEEAVAQGLDTASLPDDSIRPLVLAHHLENLPWLEGHPENGPGLAREFVAFFDEARLYGRVDLLQGSSSLEAVLTRGDSAEGEVLSGDVLRIGEVWNIYRQAVPRDGVDLLLEAAAGAAGRPRRQVDFLAVAGFARLDPTGAALIRAQAQGAETAYLYQPGSDSLLSRFFTCTWGPGSSGLDPLAPSRLVARRLDPDASSEVEALPDGSLRQRLDDLGDTSGLWQPAGPLELAACADQEQESLLITDRVVQLLGESRGNQKSIVVAANDPLLAARVVAQLRDAGIDVDNTLGQPLSTLPAGLLLRFILRAALTGLRPEPLLEILTHPYTRIGGAETRQEISTLRLEKKLREQDVLPDGPEAMLRLARENDEAARQAFGTDTHELEDFVSAVVTAFQPLLAVGSGTSTASGFLNALRQTWSALAPDHRLVEDKSQADLTAADRMLNRLEKDEAWLPESTLASFTADLNRLLSSENVPPHRTTGLPVMVAGLVEARLEKCDHLIIAGMNEGKFPTKGTRPLFLNARVRTRLDLPGWKETLARDAELFLRLLHNAPQVLVTWSVEEAGRPLLPSPFVERLKLGLPADFKIEISAPAHRWRRHSDPLAQIAADQKAFLGESLEVPVLARSRDLNRLSWTALRHWRECPYRFLLERGFALRKEEEVQEEFGRRDSGNLIHEIMHDFLEPWSPGYQCLAEGKVDQAADLLEQEARKKFMPQGQTLPGRALWLGSFLRWVPGVIEYEIDRFQQWRPVDLEPHFSLPLPDLVTWMAEQINLGEVTGDVPRLSPDQAAIVLEGAIDRVDAAVDASTLAVIDFKTGKVPPVKQVTELRELQVLLYALAVEGKALDLPVTVHRVSEAFYYAIGEEAVGMTGKAHFQGDRQLLFDAAAQLVEMARAAAKADGPFPLIPEERNGEGPAALPCGYCSFRGSCRLEERVQLPPATEVKLDKLVSRKEGGLF